MSVRSARRLLHRAQRVLPRAQRGVTVLAYHLVDGQSGSPVDIGAEAFEAQLAWLSANCTVVPLLDADPEGPEDQVVLTFDDAYLNFYEMIWPVLQRYSMPSTLYVPVDYIDGGDTPIRGKSIPAASWAQLRELADAGVEIGSHTLSHPDLRALGARALLREIRDSRDALQQKVGHAVESFCYPRALHTPASHAVVQSHYRLGVIGSGRKWTAKTPSAQVPRVPIRVEHDTSCLAAAVRSPVWLEEYLADAVRQHRA